MSRWLRGRLPEELCDVVGRHLAALDVQRVARGAMVRWALRWTRRVEWGALRDAIDDVGRRLGVGGCGNIVAELASYETVTDEWKTEPTSWLLTLQSSEGTETLSVILNEVRRGEWGRARGFVARN